jgi:hypothetical protein
MPETGIGLFRRDYVLDAQNAVRCGAVYLALTGKRLKVLHCCTPVWRTHWRIVQQIREEMEDVICPACHHFKVNS